MSIPLKCTNTRKKELSWLNSSCFYVLGSPHSSQWCSKSLYIAYNILEAPSLLLCSPRQNTAKQKIASMGFWAELLGRAAHCGSLCLLCTYCLGQAPFPFSLVYDKAQLNAFRDHFLVCSSTPNHPQWSLHHVIQSLSFHTPLHTHYHSQLCKPLSMQQDDQSYLHHHESWLLL